MKYENILAASWRKRLKTNRNVIVVFVGPTGEGKSLSSGRMGELTTGPLHDGACCPHLVFRTEQFLEYSKRHDMTGHVLMWDEAGLGIPAREWNRVFNKVAGYITQSFRFKNMGLFITVPDLSFIDVQERKLAHWIVHCKQANRDTHLVTASAYRIASDPINGNFYTPLPVFQDGAYVYQLREFFVSLPSQGFQDRYEAERKAYIAEYYEELTETVKEAGE